MSATQKARSTRQPLVNRVVTWLLRSPASRLVDRSLVLLAVTGHRSGRTYTFPVQYARLGESLWVYVGDGADKTWWRNLTSPAPVQVLLRRTVHTGTAQAFCGRQHPEEVGEGLRRYRARYPRLAQRLRATDAETVMVRVDLQPARPRE
jgi:deazaflavin-dependent oxidoreductase (nitroreductase family)